MSYVPGYLELLSIAGTDDGWPKGIDEAGKTFATERVRAGLEKFGQMDLDKAKRCIFDHYIDDEPVPGCLKGVTRDWLYAVSYRALSAISAKQVFVADTSYVKKTATAKVWHTVPVSRADVEALVALAGILGERVK